MKIKIAALSLLASSALLAPVLSAEAATKTVYVTAPSATACPNPTTATTTVVTATSTIITVTTGCAAGTGATTIDRDGYIRDAQGNIIGTVPGSPAATLAGAAGGNSTAGTYTDSQGNIVDKATGRIVGAAAGSPAQQQQAAQQQQQQGGGFADIIGQLIKSVGPLLGNLFGGGGSGGGGASSSGGGAKSAPSTQAGPAGAPKNVVTTTSKTTTDTASKTTTTSAADSLKNTALEQQKAADDAFYQTSSDSQKIRDLKVANGDLNGFTFEKNNPSVVTVRDTEGKAVAFLGNTPSTQTLLSKNGLSENALAPSQPSTAKPSPTYSNPDDVRNITDDASARAAGYQNYADALSEGDYRIPSNIGSIVENTGANTPTTYATYSDVKKAANAATPVTETQNTSEDAFPQDSKGNTLQGNTLYDSGDNIILNNVKTEGYTDQGAFRIIGGTSPTGVDIQTDSKGNVFIPDTANTNTGGIIFDNYGNQIPVSAVDTNVGGGFNGVNQHGVLNNGEYVPNTPPVQILPTVTPSENPTTLPTQFVNNSTCICPTSAAAVLLADSSNCNCPSGAHDSSSNGTGNFTDENSFTGTFSPTSFGSGIPFVPAVTTPEFSGGGDMTTSYGTDGSPLPGIASDYASYYTPPAEDVSTDFGSSFATPFSFGSAVPDQTTAFNEENVAYNFYNPTYDLGGTGLDFSAASPIDPGIGIGNTPNTTPDLTFDSNTSGTFSNPWTAVNDYTNGSQSNYSYTPSSFGSNPATDSYGAFGGINFGGTDTSGTLDAGPGFGYNPNDTSNVSQYNDAYDPTYSNLNNYDPGTFQQDPTPYDTGSGGSYGCNPDDEYCY